MTLDDRVHRELRAAWDAASAQTIDNVSAMREEFLATAEPAPRDPDIAMGTTEVPGPKGAPPVRIRTYVPRNRPDHPLPGLLWIHGGGYLFGRAEDDDGLCQMFSRESGAFVVSVDYRLAPEHPFPAGLEDCYAVLQWLHAETARFSLDPARIGVAGMSAGGGLTAALALLARDRGGPPIAFQMPLYPMLDDRNLTPSSHEIQDERTWSREKNRMAWAHYLGRDPGGEDVSPYAAPARARGLAGLPPAYTMVGAIDLFRDETVEYMTRLARAGVPVEFHVVPGAFHAFELAVPEAEVSRTAQREYVGALCRGLRDRFV